MRYHHGSRDANIKILRTDSYVTPYKDDALIFAIPWDSDEVDWTKTQKADDGRPPKHIVFKRGVFIEDCRIFLYEIDNPSVKEALTNRGTSYPWNRQLTQDCKVRLVLEVGGWKNMLEVGIHNYLRTHLSMESIGFDMRYLKW